MSAVIRGPNGSRIMRGNSHIINASGICENHNWQKRTAEYRGWVEGYARNHKVPIVKADKGGSKEELVRPHLHRLERRNQHGVYFIFTSIEMGSTFRSQRPRFPTDDPDYRIIRRVPSDSCITTSTSVIR